MRQALLISWVAWAGCVAGHESDPSAARPSETSLTQSLDLPWEPEQGTHILGSAPDALTLPEDEYLRVSTLPVFRTKFLLSVTAAADGANLVADSDAAHYERADPWFMDLILAVSDGGQLKITGVSEVGADDIRVDGVVTNASSTLYSLSYRPLAPDGSYGAWVDYCGGKGGAIPLRGWYDASRIHRNGDAISFACPDGIALKCNFWGYVPGNGGPSTAGWQYHQACTGMGNANYCRTGRSFTREQTPIQIRDARGGYGFDALYALEHPATMPGDPDTYYIEAGWDENGGPICLSKIRWAALSPNPCPGVLPDPRFSGDPEARFCDDWTFSELFTNGAVLVNGSKRMDAPLHRWKNPSTGDEVSTIRGYFIDRDQDGEADFGPVPPSSLAPSSLPPFPGYVKHLGIEGMLLRNLPSTLAETQMQPLSMQNLAAGDRYLDLGAGRSDPGFEGYSFHPDAQTSEGLTVVGLQPLSLCAGPAGLDTRLVPPGQCTSGKSLSFALPAP